MILLMMRSRSGFFRRHLFHFLASNSAICLSPYIVVPQGPEQTEARESGYHPRSTGKTEAGVVPRPDSPDSAATSSLPLTADLLTQEFSTITHLNLSLLHLKAWLLDVSWA